MCEFLCLSDTEGDSCGASCLISSISPSQELRDNNESERETD